VRAKGVPDMVVEEPQLMEYPTNVGAPAFIVPSVLSHKQERGVNATHFLEAKFNDLKDEYYRLVELANDTELVYNAKYNFIPTVGNTYHLYVGGNEELFLSIIEPSQWSMEYKGSFLFTVDSIWERVS